jgi:hypothetical protein
MSIPLRHRNRFVTEDILEHVKIAAIHHPLRGKSMPQIVEV